MAVPPPPEGWTARLLAQNSDSTGTCSFDPRLGGLTDEEYCWEPAGEMWSVRRRDETGAALVGGSGLHVMEWAFPEPDPAPLTTIAWRLAHLIVNVFGERNANHFGGPPTGFFAHDYAGTAADALTQLDGAVDRWCRGVESLSDDDLLRPVGEAEGPFAQHPYADLILHVHREAIHHGAEISLPAGPLPGQASPLSIRFQ